jgi:hypothetical protein
VPSTYDASRAYLDAELQKPKNQRDLLKEMCVIHPIAIPGDRKLHVIVQSQQLIIPIYKGCPRICTLYWIALANAFVAKAAWS